jgi:TolB-like protein/DNA-binding winged helix-turn-helix (wHTH) protein
VDISGSAQTFLFEDFRFDRAGGCLFRTNGGDVAEPVALGSRALALLGLLVERHGRLVTKDEIFTAVWPGIAVEEANLTVQVSALRRILDRDREQGSCIQTVPGRGYRFVPPVARAEAGSGPSSSRGGNGSNGPSSANEQPILPAAMRPNEGLSPVPPLVAPYRFRRTVIAVTSGALFLVAVFVVAMNWRALPHSESPSAPRLSIVVLPFTSLGGDPDQQYLTEALTKDLTVDMSQIAHIFVISSNTAFTYRNKPVDTKQIGRELGVRYVLEGSVERAADRVRVNVQLIDAGTDRHLWAKRYESTTSDLFSLQDEITGRIARQLNGELATAAAFHPTDPPDALQYILRGRAAWNSWPTHDNDAQAIRLFEQALALDPQSIEARTWLADVLATRALRGETETATADISRAHLLVEQALAAAPRNAQAHFVKGQILRAQSLCEKAIPEYETVITLNGNFAGAYADLGWCKFMIGSIGEVIPLQERAIRLGPRDSFLGTLYFRIGIVHLLQSEIAEAIRSFEKARMDYRWELADLHAWLAAAYALEDETERAATEVAEAKRLSNTDRFSSISQARAAFLRDHPVEKIRALFEGTYVVGLRKAGMPEQENRL